MQPTYEAGFVGQLPSAEAFQSLLQLSWLAVTEARQEYFMSDIPRSYVYGRGEGQREYSSRPFTPLVGGLLAQLNAKMAVYNVCFLNRYDGQHHHLGWHADDSPQIDMKHPIAVISFGEDREIWWRHRTQKGVVPVSQRQLLQNGSLFIMPANFQDEHQHRIPKCDHSCGTRISLTFRRYIT